LAINFLEIRPVSFIGGCLGVSTKIAYNLKTILMNTNKSTGERRWIKVGDDPLRYEYGRESDNPFLPKVKDQLAFVEEEKYSSQFHWETYTDPHKKGTAPDVDRAQKEAQEVLQKQT
jgi:hypothetical protein